MLKKYNHDRDMPLNLEVDKFKEFIDGFAETEESKAFSQFFSGLAKVPVEKVHQEYKKQVSESYDWKLAKFDKKLKFSQFIKYILKTIVFYIYILVHSKNIKTEKEVDLVIDWIECDLEARRWEKLHQKFKSSLLVLVQPFDSHLDYISRPS